MLLLAAFSARADVEFLWGVDGAGIPGSPQSSSLYAINPGNGQVLGLIGACGANTVSGLSRHPSTGLLYATQGQNGPRKLLRIDKTTGAATVIGSTTNGVMDTAFASNGTLYGWDATTRKLVTINLSTGALTQIGTNISSSNPVGITFGLNGTLYLETSVVSAQLYTVNPATGNKILGPLAGSVTKPSNLLSTDSAGRLVAGVRGSGGTGLYFVNPTTGAMSLIGTVALSLDGITFDTAAAPSFAVNGRKKIKTTKASVTIRGTATSVLPLTVSAKGKSAIVAAGSWSLKVKLKKGKNKLTLVCADGMGQSVATTVTVTRN